VKITVIGGGSWGTAFSLLLAERGHEVTLACRDPEQARAIAETGRNPRHLSDADLSGITAAALAGADLAGADLLVLAVPSRDFASAVAELPPALPVLSLTKGLDPASGNRLSTLLEGRSAAVLSGPNFAREIASGLPAAAVIASEDEDFAVELQHAINSLVFRVYVNTDLIGVELCAAAKNVMALAAGAVDGLGFGDNAKAALITRGLAEMSRLAAAQGARPETSAGLAGMGDLIATCWSRLSRNRRAGELIAQGASPEEAIEQIGEVVEGLTTAPVLRDLAVRLGIELPITEGACRVLAGHDLGELVSELMGRRPKEE
jgi:glycerol-3-phosphate dehydrogenase (NAD(P)+)